MTSTKLVLVLVAIALGCFRISECRRPLSPIMNYRLQFNSGRTQRHAPYYGPVSYGLAPSEVAFIELRPPPQQLPLTSFYQHHHQLAPLAGNAFFLTYPSRPLAYTSAYDNQRAYQSQAAYDSGATARTYLQATIPTYYVAEQSFTDPSVQKRETSPSIRRISTADSGKFDPASPDAHIPHTNPNAPCLYPPVDEADTNRDQLSTSSDSQNYPVYVLPPKNFRPVVYTRGPSNLLPLLPGRPSKGNAAAKSPEEYWYEEPKFLNHDSSEHKQNKFNRNELNGYAAVPKESTPKIDYAYDNDDNLPVLEASSRPKARDNNLPLPTNYYRAINPYNQPFISFLKAKKAAPQLPLPLVPISSLDIPLLEASKSLEPPREYKTKLPVGLTSFFFGGIRGINGRHWAMPASLVEQLEFMPNLSPVASEEKYYPNGDRDLQPPSSTTVELEPAEVPVSDGTGEQETKQDEGSIKLNEGSQEALSTSDPLSKFAGNAIIDSEIDREVAESQVAKINLPASLMHHDSSGARDGKRYRG